MAIITLSFTFSAGETISASEHNSNFSTIYNEFNGNIDNNNIKTSAGIVASKLDLSSVTQNVSISGDLTLTGTANDFSGATISDLGTVSAGSLSGITNFGMSTVTNISDILDEDTLSSDSATALATQQSIKAYVDTQGVFSDVFTTAGAGTWTAPTSVNYVWITMVGAGGGGGGGSGSAGGGGGGEGGQTVFRQFYRVTPGVTYDFTVGSGGTGGSGSGSGGSDDTDGADGADSTFNDNNEGTGEAYTFTVTVTGGDGGTSATGGRTGGTGEAEDAAQSFTAGNGGTGVSGGAAGTITINAQKYGGGAGGDGENSGTQNGGGGGASLFSAGGAGSTSAAVGGDGTSGSGGGGGGDANSGNLGTDGGDGGDGVLIIEYIKN